jgi:hypothetical protein
MVRITFPLARPISLDAFVITQFCLAPEEELNVEINRQTPKSAPGQKLFSLPPTAYSKLSLPAPASPGTGFARPPIFEKAAHLLLKYSGRNRNERGPFSKNYGSLDVCMLTTVSDARLEFVS